ncbi:hypothetical protein JCM19239_7727 [Vibrio variabilis]|uniref:Wadjet protein JetD C-terminal domain-containing protein n=1 Tax=Vibrio variabilis TaxID=990271 RepID=A0ABQ0J4R8_9VIBR|nr:hypothetical protein JCM19239_7727 [Vibrio variabilis]
MADKLPVFFAGDLDYAGISIINSLQARFPNLRPFRPQYRALIALVKAGGGHSPEEADKTGQHQPNSITDIWLSDKLNDWKSCVAPSQTKKLIGNAVKHFRT